MNYRVELHERDYLGPLIAACSLGEARFPSIVQAVGAAKEEAYEWMQRLGSTVAIVVLHDEQVLSRHLLPLLQSPAGPARPGLGLHLLLSRTE